MTRKPLSPEAEAALQAAMRKACERMELLAQARREVNEMAEAIVRLCDEMGPNI